MVVLNLKIRTSFFYPPKGICEKNFFLKFSFIKRGEGRKLSVNIKLSVV